MIRLAWLAMLLPAGCAATHTPPTRLMTLQPEIPSYLLNCAADPAVPAPTSQAVVANYLVSLWQAGRDCRVHLAAIRLALQQHQD